MELGAFSISLAVKDLAASRVFYEKLGFEAHSDTSAHNYLILSNGETKLGLFQGMFEQNILTFNPGWDQSAKPLDNYTDVRQIQSHLDACGLELQQRADTETDGPAHLTLIDPDGNAILIDQHV